MTYTNDQLCKAAARRYARRVWWVDEDDLRQEAHRILERARQSFDPSRGVWDRYAWRSIVRELSRVVLLASSPVSGNPRRENAREALKEARRVEVSSMRSTEDATPSPEEAVARRRWVETFEARVRAVLDADTLALAGPVLLAGEEPAEVALRMGVDVGEVYNANKRARRRLRDDVVITQLRRAIW